MTESEAALVAALAAIARLPGATVPDGPGLGVEIDEAYLAHHAVSHTVIDAAGARPA